MAEAAPPPAKRSKAAQPGGRCELILGPMFSGKSTEAIRRAQRAQLGGEKCVVVKYAADTRYGPAPELQTHGGHALAAGEGLSVHSVASLGELPPLDPDVAFIAVDEGQFFPDLPEKVDQWLREGRTVAVAALDGDFRRRPFGRVHETLPLASSVTKLSAICQRCPRGPGQRPSEAPYTLRTDASQSLELIGAADKYQAACLGCYLKAVE